MRPLELELRDFRSYHGDGARFDFRDRRLVGIVGPIGSGKSSLLDAIAFALYGKTPTSGSNRKTLINQRAKAMAVKLRFSVGDEIWEVVRQLRRKGAAQHALYRLDSDGITTDLDTADDDERAEILEKITMDGAVNERIEELLGLDYEAFGRSVMLAQNRFSEFLSAGAAQRDVVLKGVFGHDRIDAMRTTAKEFLAKEEAVLDKLTVRTDQLEQIGVRLAATTVKRDAAAKRLERLTEAVPREAELEQRIETATAAETAAAKQLESISEAGAALPTEEKAEDLLDAAHGAAARRKEHAALLEEAAARLADAEAAMAALAATGEDALIDKASTLLTQRTMQRTQIAESEKTVTELDQQLGSVTGRIDELAKALAAAKERGERATAAVTAADQAVAEARRAVVEAERSDMATTLRATLEIGHACPVCDQQVAAVPDMIPAAQIDDLRTALAHRVEHRVAAEEERTAAIADLSRLGQAVDAERRAHDEIVDRHRTAVEQLESRQRELERVAAELDDLVGTGDHAALLEERRKRRGGLSDAVQRHKQELDKARHAHEQVVRDAQTVDREMSGLVATLAAVGAKLGLPVTPDREHPDEVATAFGSLRTAWSDAVTTQRDAMASAATDRTEALAALSALRTGLDVDRPLPEAVAALEATLTHLGQEIERDQKELDSAETLLEDKRTAERRIEVFGQLVRDLRDSEFVRFLLDEERARLAALGSDHFLRLSSGRYAFTEDGDFSIVDLTSADAVRKSSSLSGGETFLASLALALALAEMVSRTGGRLDAFFLDEGFGSLDAEHLDLAMEGIEALVADDRDRLVVVVSHVPELRHRIDDQIQLDRDPLTGDTRIVHG